MKELLVGISCGLSIAAICVALTLLNECRHARSTASSDEIVRVED